MRNFRLSRPLNIHGPKESRRSSECFDTVRLQGIARFSFVWLSSACLRTFWFHCFRHALRAVLQWGQNISCAKSRFRCCHGKENEHTDRQDQTLNRLNPHPEQDRIWVGRAVYARLHCFVQFYTQRGQCLLNQGRTW